MRGPDRTLSQLVEKIKHYIIFPALSTILFFSALEIAIRVGFPDIFKRNVVIDLELVPKSVFKTDRPDPLEDRPLSFSDSVHCGANSCELGHLFREQKFSTARSGQTKRILFLGGSSVYSPGLERLNTIPKRFETMAGDMGYDIETLNGGISGADMTQACQVLNLLAPKFKPDTVVIYAGHNEVFPQQPVLNLDICNAVYPFIEFYAPLYRHSAALRAGAYLFQEARYKLLEGRKEFFRPRKTVQLDEELLNMLLDLKQSILKRAEDRLRWVIDYCESRGVEIVLCLPTSNLLYLPGICAHGPNYPAVKDAWDKTFKLANRAYRKGRFEKACSLYEELIRLDPHFTIAYHFLGMSLLHMNRTSEARAAFDELFERTLIQDEVPGKLGAPPSLAARLKEVAESRGAPVWDTGWHIRGGIDPSDDWELFVDYVHFSDKGALKFATELANTFKEKGWFERK